MKLIKEIESRRNKNGILLKWGEFNCLNPECNKIVERPLGNGLRQKSCGCIKIKENTPNYKHGGIGTNLYYVWVNMKNRCLNMNSQTYKNYGGRGITICPKWTDKENGFINFRNWALNNSYQKGLEIDRIDNDGNYEPSNCRWVIKLESNRNKRNTITIQIANEIRGLDKTGLYTQKEMANKYNVTQTMISYIINNKKWVDT